MSIYIDEEFDATTLADLERQAVERAREAWDRHLLDNVQDTYRDLARESVAAGTTTVEDHPWFSPAALLPSADGYFDITSPFVLQFWQERLNRELAEQYAGFKYIDHVVNLRKKES